ncbi:MAG: nitrile hydratase subunit beta [Granulosicoccaceae bacterium]
MNGAQDLGGMQCFGAVVEVPDEPLFHQPWERRVFAMALAMGASGAWNLDQSRFARESLPADFYLSAGYYRIWLAAMQELMKQRDLVTEEELRAGQMMVAPKPVPRVARAELIPAALAAGSPVERQATTPALFGVGQRLRVRRDSPAGHTRVPRYIRGCVGTVVRVHGCHVFAESNARGDGEDPRWLYNLCFDANELWGASAQRSSVHVDCWEPSLELI